MNRNAFPSSFLALALAVGLAAGVPAQARADAAQADAALQAAAQAIATTHKQAELWTTTGALMKKAKAARAAGDFAKAAKLADEAKAQAQLAFNQFFEGKAEFTAERLQRTHGLTTAQHEALKEVEGLLRRHEGYDAYKKVDRLKAEVVEGHHVYRVRPGDTLGKIALREYGSRNEWRAIYEQNRSRLADPNALRPGQELILRNVLAD